MRSLKKTPSVVAIEVEDPMVLGEQEERLAEHLAG